MQSHRPAMYRPDIDGLRAIAVLSIIVFHIGKVLLPGGFVGVDIFFVISGFLITGNILRDRDARRFSLLEFYGRRVKRIAPALMVVVLTTIVAAQFLLRPQDAERAAESGGWALASLANVYFWLFQDTGYFASASAEEPLLHLWSLGVEEQFYLIWPLALGGLYRLRDGSVLRVTIVVALASFALGQWLYPWDVSFVYYMLPSRAGELLIGAIVAVLLRRQNATEYPARLRAGLALAGACLIGASLFLLSEDHVFPGFNAMPPTLGTAALILAGSSTGSWISRVLASRPLVGVGLISYSAYLWHWPLLAFYRYGHPTITPASGVALFGLILAVAWASYRFVEIPGRQVSMGAGRVIVVEYIGPAIVVCAIALGVTKTDGYGLRWWSSDYRTKLATEQQRTLPAFRFDYVCQSNRLDSRDVTDERCVLGGEGSQGRHALLWGDSNASHYVGMVATFAQEAAFRFRNVEVGSCPPLLSDPGAHVAAARLADCRHSLELVRPLIDDAPVVMIAASWPSYNDGEVGFLDAFFETVRRLSRQDKHVVLLGKAPVIPTYDRRCPEKALSYPFLRCASVEAPPSPTIAAINERLRVFAEQTPGVGFFDVTPYLCDQRSCRSAGADGEPRYYDTGHLTLAASWKLGEEILRRDGLPEAFGQVARNLR